MRRFIGALAAGALLLVGCGGTTTFANKAKPPVPIALTVYINDSRVSLSPGHVGAGEVTLIVTNQAASAQALRVSTADQGSTPLASTGPINPQATTQLNVNLDKSGRYVVSAATPQSSDAAQAAPGGIHPATLDVGPPRPGSRNTLGIP